MPPAAGKRLKTTTLIIAIGLSLALLIAAAFAFWLGNPARGTGAYDAVTTIAGVDRELGEPFGIAVRGTSVYVSDGQADKIWIIDKDSAPRMFASGLDTPSAIAFDESGKLIVADTGSHTIKLVDVNGEATSIAGVPGQSGYLDGDAATAQFYAPIGIAVGSGGRIYVADTYNDRIRLIENGKVSTVAGESRGFADGIGASASFDTPTGLAIWRDKLLVADSGNRRIRVVEADGRVWTLAGDGLERSRDGMLLAASLVLPTGIAVAGDNQVFIADGNSIRRIGGDFIPAITTLSGSRRGMQNGPLHAARFNRPSGLAIDIDKNLLVTDSENAMIRRFMREDVRETINQAPPNAPSNAAQEFKELAPPRWPFDPPGAKRDIAGTLGEIRGEIRDDNNDVWFHNGLDIAGAYGETSRFIRDEKVLRPTAAENFGTLRELLRMPTLGYVHIRLGRDSKEAPLDDTRFSFERDAAGKTIDVRVPRGSKFRAGEAIGTLNAMNHVHLIAGSSGSELNALAALGLPGLSDSRPPVIENVKLFDQNWREIEIDKQKSRIKLIGKTRIVVSAYDQMDGNAERRRLGVHRVGYQMIPDGTPAGEPGWTINFDELPPAEAVKFTYAFGSRSGATGVTTFNYIATNRVNGEIYKEEFLDAASLAAGQYILRVSVSDYFDNVSWKDLMVEVLK